MEDDSAYSSDYRKKQRIRGNSNKYMNQNTPSSSDEDNIPEVIVINNEGDNDETQQRRVEARRRSIVQRKKRNSIQKRKDLPIDNSKKKLANDQQRNRRLKCKMMKNKKALTPKSKIEAMANDPNQKAELVPYKITYILTVCYNN